MGNLNKFYLMGRVARAPQTEGEGQQQVVTVALTPGTSQRGPRGGPSEPLLLEAVGAQAESALQLRAGQGVFLRGQLRQEPRGQGSALVARIQAIELLGEPRRRPRPPREGDSEVDTDDGDESTSGKRRRGRRRGRGRGRERGETRPAGDPAQAPAGDPAQAPAGDSAQAPADGGEGAPPRKDLPPPAPVVQTPVAPVQPPPDPTLESDMPF